MSQPRAQPVTGIVLHGAELCCRSERIRNPPGGSFVIARKANPDMAIVEDRIIWPVGLFDLIERLSDQEAFQAITRHKCQRGFEEVEPSEGGKLVQHQEHPMPMLLSTEIFRQPSPDLVEYQPYQRLGSAYVGWRHDQVQRGRLSAFDEVTDAPIASSRDLRDNGIAVKTEKRHCRRQYAGALVFALGKKLACGRGNDRMWTGTTKM